MSLAAPFLIESGVSLAAYTTLELGGRARGLTVARSEVDVQRILEWARNSGWPLLFIGGGSNLVIGDDGFDGLAVHIDLRGRRVESGGEVWAAAGEPWDDLVAETVEAGLGSFACLSGIPGSVGATPIQNVGAYGAEVAETLTEVRVMHRVTGAARSLLPEDCAFGYRDSLFKRDPSWVVLSVRFRLRPGPPELRYGELTRALQGRAGSPQEVREAVLEIRGRKSMVLRPHDPNRRSVGSFFTNPVVAPEVAAKVAAIAAGEGLGDPPQYPSHAGVKLSAAWLIERSGIEKGLRRGLVGVSSAHTLALVHHGGGTTGALLALAAEVRAAVEARFGVRLAPEPQLVSCSLTA